MQIEQIDRDAAAKALGYATWEDATDYRNSGEEDRRVAHMVQAFAQFRHRLAALSARDAQRAAMDELIAASADEIDIPERPADSDMVERVGKAVHEKLSRQGVIAYLNMPDDTAEVVARAAIAAMGSADMGKGGEG